MNVYAGTHDVEANADFLSGLVFDGTWNGWKLGVWQESWPIGRDQDHHAAALDVARGSAGSDAIANAGISPHFHRLAGS